MAALLGGIVLALPKDPVEVTQPLQPILPALMIGSFFALRFFGQGTEAAQDTKINLWGFQPMEVVKLLFVIFLANYFGRRAEKLRHQRDRLFGMQFPRKELLWPAVALMIALFGAFVLLNDLGPTLILSIVFLFMFYVVTRASGWVALAIGIVALGVFAITHVPAIAESPKVALRLKMWVDPWYNGLPFGDQTARSAWAIAAGGAQGQGLGQAPATALPAGHTDLIIAHLAEELGAFGLVPLHRDHRPHHRPGPLDRGHEPDRGEVAARGGARHTPGGPVRGHLLGEHRGPAPDRRHRALPVLRQDGDDRLRRHRRHAGAAGGKRRRPRDHPGADGAAQGRPGRAGRRRSPCSPAAIGVAIWQGVVIADQTTTRGVVTLLAREAGETTDRVGHLHDPRLQAIADRIRRGDIVDRNGQHDRGHHARTGGASTR